MHAAAICILPAPPQPRQGERRGCSDHHAVGCWLSGYSILKMPAIQEKSNQHPPELAPTALRSHINYPTGQLAHRGTDGLLFQQEKDSAPESFPVTRSLLVPTAEPKRNSPSASSPGLWDASLAFRISFRVSRIWSCKTARLVRTVYPCDLTTQYVDCQSGRWQLVQHDIDCGILSRSRESRPWYLSRESRIGVREPFLEPKAACHP
jgi:hypothetical protein